MKVLNHILHPLKKFTKGMLVLLTLNTLVVVCVFIFDSCKKAAYDYRPAKKANEKFMAALNKNKKAIGDVSFASHGSEITSTANTANQTSEPQTEPIYLNFPTEVDFETYTMFQNTNSIQELSDLIQTANATVQYEATSTNSNFQINVPVETVANSLNPLIQESKQYLYSMGFTEQDIQQMIAEENAIEADLIPLVMSMTLLEDNLQVARNYLGLFPINAAYANMSWSEVGRCAIHALGFDAIFSLTSSGAKVWSMATIKTVFKTVAKRMLGPIGVAIAVVDFGLCLGGVEL